MRTIVLADDQINLCNAYKKYFELSHDCKVLGEAVDGFQLLNLLQTLDNLPEFALIDLKMPKIDGIAVIDIITYWHPNIKCIGFSQFTEPNIIVDVLMAGAKGYVQKGYEEDFSSLFTEISNGRIFVPERQQIALAFFNECKKHIKLEMPHQNKLTKKELLFLKLISCGLSFEEIAKLLFVSISTLNNHQANIKQKIGYSDKQLQTLFAHQQGIAKCLRFNQPNRLE